MQKLAAAGMAILLMVLCTEAIAQQDDDRKFALPHITVDGHAHIEIKPDLAVMSLGVVVERPTAGDAVSENARLSMTMIADIKKLGIAPEDIQTTHLAVEPVFIEKKDNTNNLAVSNLKCNTG